MIFHLPPSRNTKFFMKNSFLLFLYLISHCLLHAQDSNARFKQLESLQGTWSMQTKRGIIYESWIKSSDTSFAGKSFRVVNTDTLLLEEVRLVKRGNDILYIPTVRDQNNQQPVIFKLLPVENETFTFDNPLHDFPQRVIYELPKNGALHARIEGMDKGSYRKSDFHYKRVL